MQLPHPLPRHPRLLARDTDFERVRVNVSSDPTAGKLFASIQSKAETLLKTPALTREMTGRRLLGVSRNALARISVLAISARVTGDDRYVRRAIEEMLAVAQFTDWNPSHFLDTAEMALAVAIGYDWLNDRLNDSERQEVADALLEKGLKPSISSPQSWITDGNNWNQVCHAGMSAAAIAIADREPELATFVLERAATNIAYAARVYAPDGAYPEGPMYWDYGTTFHVILAAAFERFFGETLGVDEFPGFDRTAEYLLQLTAPSGRFFNYADCRQTRGLVTALFWLAARFKHPEWLRSDLLQLESNLEACRTGDFNRVLVFALLWWQPSAISAGAAPLHWFARGIVPVSVHCSSHEDPEALYAAIKGGSPSASHGHMDGGSFILEANGIRWAIDLGMQDYESLESKQVRLWQGEQNGMRWKIFRLGPDSHNILRFNNHPQLIKGNGRYTAFRAEGPYPCSVVDLSSLYLGEVNSVRRGLMFLENRAVLFQDEWSTSDEPVEVTWQMLTTAKVQYKATEIELSESGKRLILRVLAPEDAVIETEDVSKPGESYDAENPGATLIRIKTSTPANSQGSIRLVAIPEGSGPIEIPLAQPLSQWAPPLTD